MRYLLTALLAFISSFVFAQSKVYIRGDSIYIQRIGGNGELILENGTKNVTGGVLTNIGNGRTQFVVPSGGGLSGSNLGSGFRFYSPGSQGIKTLFNGYAILPDSTSNTNGITLKADTNLLATRLRLQKVGDSLGAVISGIGTDASADSLLNRYNQIPEHGIIFSPTDTIILVGDSYGSGTGATSPSTEGWMQKLVIRLGNPVFSNYSISGSTVMKRTPIDYNGTANLIDRIATLPSGASNKKLMIIAMGLNDVGQTAAAYSVANFKTDYDSVIHYLTTTKGWDPRKILLLPPYYIGQAGYNAYGVITGNAAPTPARHRDIVYKVKQVAQQWGTLYADIYYDQLQNDTTLMNADAIHANTAGHDYIYKDVFNYIAGASQSSNFNLNSTSRILTPKGALYTGLSTTTPFQINMGGNYYSTPGTPLFSTKFITYYDGSANNTSGLGVSTDGQEYHTFGNHNFYSLAVRTATLSSTLAEFFANTQITKAGNATIDMLRLNHSGSFSSGQENQLTFSSGSNNLARIANYYEGTGSLFGMKFYSFNGSALNTTPFITGLSSNNVGIAITTPLEKLHVNGKVKIDDVPAAAVSSLDSSVVMEDGRIKFVTNGAGTWTPTASAAAGGTVGSVGVFTYSRQGNIVTISGKVTITHTTGSSLMTFELSLPSGHTSNFASDENANGVVGTVVTGSDGVFEAEPTNDTIKVSVYGGPTAGAGMGIRISGQYRVI